MRKDTKSEMDYSLIEHDFYKANGSGARLKSLSWSLPTGSGFITLSPVNIMI